MNNSVIPAMPKTRHRQETLIGRMIMHIKSILSAAAIALAATIGSASAADQFTALDGVTAEPMNAVEMAAVVGANVAILIDGNVVSILGTDEPLVGLENAEASGAVFEAALAGGARCPPAC